MRMSEGRIFSADVGYYRWLKLLIRKLRGELEVNLIDEYLFRFLTI